MKIDLSLTPADLASPARNVLQLSAQKVRRIRQDWDSARGTPVFTVQGRYTARGWTEWTQGFQYGCAILAYDGLEDQELLTWARQQTVRAMASHVTHVGVHDHGFNNVSTYGNLRRLVREGRIPFDPWEMRFYDLALKASAAAQAARWAPVADGQGFVYSFNGPHSLFIDTMRTLRVLGLGHQLGHTLMGENDARISLLGRSVVHGLTSARYNLFFGKGRDAYDTAELRGRTVHEAIFNRNDGRFRCPSSQQGYSPFTTWTRGLAWAMCGYAEELEFLAQLDESEFLAAGLPAKSAVLASYLEAAQATSDFYIDQAAARDGICYWDTGAPGLAKMGDYRSRPAEPFNDHEPVDSSASVIAAQGLLRLGRYLGAAEPGRRYTQAGLTVAKTLFADPYLCADPSHQGLILHSIYHRPNGWDFIPPGRKIPCGESSMWGDYHAIELALLLSRLAASGPYLTFFDSPANALAQRPAAS